MATPPQIGLDIGTVSVRASEVVRGKDRPVFHNFGQVALPHGAVVGGVVKDERVVVGALRQLWAKHGFRSKAVNIGVSHQQVVVREVEIANLPPKELRRALPYQAREVMPFPADRAVLDFYPLETAAKRDMVRGLLVAAPKETVTDTVRVIEKAGLHVARVDLACFAVLRAVAGTDHECEAIVDVGAQDTLIVVHVGGIPQLVRTIPRGGHEITKLVSSRLNVSTADAEALKCQVGTLARRPEDVETAETILEALRPLLGEIRSSVSYVAGGQAGRSVGRVSLVGGASQLPGFAEALGRALGVPAAVADPLRYVADDRRGGRHDLLVHHLPSAAVSIGLTLGAA